MGYVPPVYGGLHGEEGEPLRPAELKPAGTPGVMLVLRPGQTFSADEKSDLAKFCRASHDFKVVNKSNSPELFSESS
jgi:hypothetical protein